MIKQWLIFGLAVGVFASCSQEGNEPNSTAEVGGETVSFSLSAEVSVDDPSLRAIDYKLGNNANGELVPMPQFTDKQEVEVHTILKSSNGAVAAKTLKWRYNAASKKLVLSQNDGHSITVSGFNNDNGVKWYVSGLIGGELIPNTTRVTFAGERVLKGVDGNAGDIVGSLNVPYAFGWTELTINTSGARESNNSYKYAEVPKESLVKFVPQGSLIAYKLGNAQISGSYTFSLKGFTVLTNTWGDQGEFELSTAIPTVHPEKMMPLWTESSSGSNMYYTFADGHTPSAIAHNGSVDKTYYAWVIAHKEQPTTAEVRVMLKGESSRPETATYKDYTRTYFTDYAPRGTGTQGRVVQGKVHKLTAKATRRVALPIEYVTDYNLAGGEGLTYITRNFTNPQPAGVTGELRFADSHSNDASGYYDWHKLVGRKNNDYNPQERSLQAEVDRVFGSDKYYVPSREQWWGVFPFRGFYWSTTRMLDGDELMAFGSGHDLIRQSYRADYSSVSTDNSNQDAYIYAIRFKTYSTPPSANVEHIADYDPVTGTSKHHIYPPARDNSLKCAYRFRRVGGATAWNNSFSDNSNLNNQLIIDVVYLGEEVVPTSVDAISNAQWWDTKKTEGLVISKTFPAAGHTYSGNAVFGALRARGYSGNYWSCTQVSTSSFASADVVQTQLGTNGSYSYNYGFPVRLFRVIN